MARLPRLSDLGPEDVKGLSIDQLLTLLERSGIGVDEAGIRAEAEAVFSRIGIALENGAEDLDPATWEAVEGRAERAFDGAVRKQVKRTIRDTRIEALREAVDAPLLWVATMVNTCESCLARHGQFMLIEEWEAEGLPGSPVLLCDGNCNCTLMPYSETPGEDVYVGIGAALPDVEVRLRGPLRR